MEAEPRLERAAARRYRSWGERALLGGVTLGALGTFYAASRAITWERGNAIDRRIVRAVGRARGPVGNVLARSITAFGGVAVVSGVFLSAVVVLRRRPRLLWQVAAGGVGAVAAELGVKRLFRRERPKLLEHLETVTSTAFPSGHAMASASIYLTLAFVASRSVRLRPVRSALLVGAGVLSAMVGGTRVYLGVHWPTDVLGGLTLGTAWACMVEAGFDFTRARALERRVEERTTFPEAASPTPC